jgi:uncharacterized protein (DUF2267 family)
MTDLLDTVAQRTRLDRAAAERAVRATLETLAERLSKGEARDLAERLPPNVAGWLHTDGGPEPFHYDEFLRRVAAREGVDAGTAERHARAVFWALGQAAPDEAEDVVAELPQDFAPVAAEALRRFAPAVDAEEFVAKVAAHGGIGAEEARSATEAVLETLAERISGGEVADLEAVLPVALRAPLERGRERTGGHATRMSLDAFLERIGRRLGVTPLQARRPVEAVFAALRETLPAKEFLDVTAELPYEYASVGARPHRDA